MNTPSDTGCNHFGVISGVGVQKPANRSGRRAGAASGSVRLDRTGGMKLLDVQRGSRIRIDDLELEFSHIDGMYSYNETDAGEVVHIKAWADVEVLRDGPASEGQERD